MTYDDQDLTNDYEQELAQDLLNESIRMDEEDHDMDRLDKIIKQDKTGIDVPTGQDYLESDEEVEEEQDDI